MVSEVGATCLHDAAVKGRIKTIEWLLKNTKLSSSCKDSNGATIWHLSSKFDQIDLIDWLIGFEGTEGAEAFTFNGATCHHFAASANAVRCLKRLIQIIPSYVNIQMVNGITPIYLSIQEKNIPITKLLLRSGANLNLRAEEGMSVIHLACQNGDLTMIQLLKEEFRASLNETDQNGASSLHYACVNGNAELVAYLLNNNVEIRADKFGNSPLHDAALNGHIECARLLIACEIDVNIKDNKGMSASELAESNGFKDLAQEIRKFEQKKKSEKIQTILHESLINRSLRKTSLLNNVQSPLFSDMTGVPSSTPSSDLDKLEELNKVNSKTYTKNQAFVQLMHRSQSNLNNSHCDVTQVSAIDELDRCIAEFESSSKQLSKIYIDRSSSICSESNKTMNRLDPDLSHHDQNNNIIYYKAPPPAPPLPSWNQRNEYKVKSPFGFLKPVDRSRKNFNFIEELSNQLKRQNESCKFEKTLEDIKKVTEYRALKMTGQDSNMPEWKRKLIERKKLRQT